MSEEIRTNSKKFDLLRRGILKLPPDDASVIHIFQYSSKMPQVFLFIYLINSRCIYFIQLKFMYLK